MSETTLDASSRLDALERRVEDIAERTARIERRLSLEPPAPAPAVETSAGQTPAPAGRVAAEPVAAPTASRAPVPAPEARVDGRELSGDPLRRAAPSLEELLGGRVLALAGGVAVLLGVAFFVAMAVNRGWIDETTRVALAFAGSTLLLGVGVWLHERRGRTQASLAAVGTAVAALYLTLTAATALYALLPQLLALAVAFVIGAVATAIAVRWNARTVAALGILGALVSPVLIEATADAGTLLFLAVALASAAGVLLWRRWDWLGLAAFLVTAPQLALWTFDLPPTAELVVVLAGFAALNVIAALGYEARVRTSTLRPSSALLVSFNAIVVAALGAIALVDRHGQQEAGLWIGALALAHLALAVAALTSRRTSQDIGLLLGGTALTLANVSFGLLVDGAILGIGWAASAAALAALARRYAVRLDAFHVGVGSQLSLAIGHTLLFEAPPGSLAGGGGSPGAVSVLAAIIVAAFASARLATGDRKLWGELLDALSLVTLAYVTAISLDGVALVLAWAGVAAAVGEVARRTGERVAGFGALGFLGLAASHTLLFEADPASLVYGVNDLARAAVALGAVSAASARLVPLAPGSVPVRRLGLIALAAASAVYLGSVAIVTAFQPGHDAVASGLDLDVRQQGQVLLSAFWSVCGLGALWVGLRRDQRELRLAGLGLLLLALAKVFLYDLSTLDSVYRVLSFVALGLLLLAAAFAYQRMRLLDGRGDDGGRIA